MNKKCVILPARNFLIRLRKIYEFKYGNVSNNEFANEIGITKGIFDHYMYRDSAIFDYLKGSALEKIVRNIFEKTLVGINWIDEKAFMDILSIYIEDEEAYIQKNNLNRTPIGNQIIEWINEKYKEENAYYSTLDFIKDLLYDLNINNKELSILFEKDDRYLDQIKQKMKNPKNPNYNPNFKFSIENLKILKNNLINQYSEQASKCFRLIDKYINMNDDLKDYSCQQYHIYHPNLDAHYFEEINTKEKAYWLGFLCADGYISKTRYGRLGIHLSIKDKDHLINFCYSIGLNVSNIREEVITNNYKNRVVTYKTVSIDFQCKPMYEDLEFHNLKSFPELYNYDLYLAWLLGLYDGDGFQGKTMVCSESKELLSLIKKYFGIKYEVREYYFNGESYIRNYDNITEINRQNFNSCERFLYILTLGSRLFNKMMRNHLNSLKRKRYFFNELKETSEKLIEEIFSSDNLQELIYTHQKKELIRKLCTTEYALDKLIDDWDLDRDWNIM